jgi:hypothetical protein
VEDALTSNEATDPNNFCSKASFLVSASSTLSAEHSKTEI